VYRDLAILISCRWLFRHSIFHFHAGGLCEFASKLSSWEQPLFWLAYRRPDCAIVLSERNPADGEYLQARAVVIVPYGIPDPTLGITRERPSSAAVRILYVGALRESKGVSILIDAARRLRERGYAFELALMGDWESATFRDVVQGLVTEHGLMDCVEFIGCLDGRPKWQAYADADLFCFPTFFESETFGVVLLEAMAFGLPVIASDWRGVGSVVVPNVTGLLVPPADAETLTQKLAELLADPDLRRTLGAAGRHRYETLFTFDVWLRNMEAALLVCKQGD
jgi:glycosyltransferase involved in cell wall biosynthesis